MSKEQYFEGYNKMRIEQELKEQKAENTSLITTVESQKEEIEKLLDEKAEWATTADHGWHVAGEETIKIESLKAITELAVKGLKEISDGGSTGEDARDMRRTADYTLSEIERLSQ